MADEYEDMADMPISIGLEDTDNPVDDMYVNRLISDILGKLQKAKDYRRQDETRWLQAYRNYRGIYGPDVQFTSSEKSRVFVKVTKTKALAAYGQITDVIFGSGKFPISIEPSKLPEGVAESVHFDPQDAAANANAPTGTEMQSPYGYEGDGTELERGATFASFLGPLRNKLDPIMDKLKMGAGKTPTAQTFEPAKVAAKKMQKKIQDQLDECHANKHLRSAIFEQVVFGTGILKGPFATDKEYPRWQEGEYTPVFKTMPKITHTSVWNFYPDPDANNIEECQYVIERHKMSRSQLRALKKRPMFRSDVIDQVIEFGESYNKEYWEDDLSDYAPDQGINRFEVFEYWGVIDREYLEEYEIDIPEELEDLDEMQCNVWFCNDMIIRLVLNPFKPSRIPYMAAPYEMNPYSFFGIGICENMEDTQILMNGFMRMAIDNAALSGNLLIEVDENNLVPGQDMSIYPGKIFRRQGGAPGQAIFGTKFPNVSQENMMMFDKARVLADESTGLPSYAHGQTGVMGVGRTASGISMLMNAASHSIKTVVKNIDDYLLQPLGQGMFHFNMQFDYDEEIVGDLEVVARGTESLMANEVRSQRLTQFMQVGANPALAPFVKFDYVLREIAKALDLDPDKVTNDMREAAIQAEIMKDNMPPQAGQMMGQAPAGANPMDMTGVGGGTIGTGVAPTPQEGGFSGNAGQAAQPPQAAGQ